jgi:hypothetical protein
MFLRGTVYYVLARPPIDITESLEPLAEVERALLVVEVLHLPHPQLGGLGLGNGREHFCKRKER